MDHSNHQHHKEHKATQDQQGKQQHHHDHKEHDHSGHHRHMIEDFKRRFWISLVLTFPILALSPMIQEWIGVNWQFTGSNYVLAALSSVVFFYGGWPFLKGLFDELKNKQPGMMTLIAIAISVAWGYSTAVAFGLEGMSFYWELATLVDIMLLGHWLEMRSVLGASKALEKLAQLMPDTAHRVKDDGNTEEVSINDLKSGDVIQIKPGEKIPADGTITEGKSSVNESMLTGESKPVDKSKGDEVIGGAVNQQGTLKVEVQRTGEDSYLSKVINMVKEAQGSKSKTQRLADKAAFWLTIVALVAGFGTLAAWLMAGFEFVVALERMVTVMVITCPHALGLAIPLVAAISTAVSAQNGLLIRNRTAFENSRKIDVIIFDKTGTLTKGDFGINRIESFAEGWDEKKILQYAAAMERNSEHPIAAGIMKKAEEDDLDFPEAKDFENITGQGVKGKVEGKEVLIVGPNYLKEKNIDIPEGAEDEAIETIVFLLVAGELKGLIGLADVIREESAEAVKTLQENDIKVYMLTGDNEKVAKSVSDELNMDGYFAEVLPDQKQAKVKELQEQGYTVAMTGDGVNDAPALAQADVGIAIGEGMDVAAETADIILVNSNPKDVVKLILFGKATHRKMIQNLFWATAYNVVAIPLAAGVLYKWGIMISPAIGAVVMSLSTIIVALNAQLLRRSMKKGE